MIIAILAGAMLLSGAMAVHKYLREHPPPDLGPRLGRVYRADHPKAAARAKADAKAAKAGKPVGDSPMVALGHLLFGAGRTLGRLGRKVAERVEAGRQVPPLEIINDGGPAATDTPPAEAEQEGDMDVENSLNTMFGKRRQATDWFAPPGSPQSPTYRPTVGSEAEQDTPQSDAAPAATAGEETTPMAATTMGALYEASEAAAAQRFEGVVAVERFLKAVASGCESVTSVWGRWAERLGGPLNVDESVVGHIRSCAPHQAMIAGLTGEASTHVTKLLDGSITDALERGHDVPHHKLMDSGGGYPAIPAFYERFGTYITHRHDDIRGELLLMAAVSTASAQQAGMFRATARRMEDAKDINVRAAADKYYAAARAQDAITALVEAAHVQFSVIIRMTMRALAESSMKAPNAQMHGVG